MQRRKVSSYEGRILSSNDQDTEKRDKMDRKERFSRKRNSIVGGAMEKFEGAAAADQFARRHSTYGRALRQSIPDIRFDERGVPISTRQLMRRSNSLAMQEEGGGVEQQVRRLSREFSQEGENPKVNFTLPGTTRAGMLGSNRRWSLKPDWMSSKKRRLSVKEEFIEKNLKNVEIPPPSSPSLSRTSSEDTTRSRSSSDLESQILEDIADESEGSSTCASESDGAETESSNFLSCFSSEAEDETHSGVEADEIFSEAVENVSDITNKVETKSENGEETQENGTDANEEVPTTSERRRSNAERRQSQTGRRQSKSGRRQSNTDRRRSHAERRNSRDRRRSSAREGILPPRPPPPPLPVEMCDVSDYWKDSSSDEEDVIVTKYGKQKICVSSYHHVFNMVNGTEVKSVLCAVSIKIKCRLTESCAL